MARLHLLSLVAGFSFLSGACGDDGSSSDDPCVGGDMPIAILGHGVGGEFVPYEAMEEVGLGVAPQGGFGVSVVVQTSGLSAGSGRTADVQLDVEDDGVSVGEFLLEDSAFFCASNGSGGNLRGVVVGFDPDVYKTNDDLLQLNDKVVDLVVTVYDEDERQAQARLPVTIKVGN